MVYNGWKWDYTVGGIGDIKTELRNYGLTDSQANELFYNIEKQYKFSSGTYKDINSVKDSNDYNKLKIEANQLYPHKSFDDLWTENYNKFRNKTDFAHQSITTATHLDNETRLADVYSMMIGAKTEELAG